MELKVWMKLEYTYKREQIRNNKCKKNRYSYKQGRVVTIVRKIEVCNKRKNVAKREGHVIHVNCLCF